MSGKPVIPAEDMLEIVAKLRVGVHPLCPICNKGRLSTMGTFLPGLIACTDCEHIFHIVDSVTKNAS